MTANKPCPSVRLGVLALTLAALSSPALWGAPAETFEDPRDGRRYPLVELGGLMWFGENLAWPGPGSFCYDGDPANCDSYGRLYRWESALRACPPGAHLSSELEWQMLERALGLPEVEVLQRRNRGTVEGARLKPGGDTGFEVQYGGWRRYEDRSFSSLGRAVAFWTSTETDLAHAQHRDIDVGDDMIWRSPVVKHYALSVRCVLDRFDQYEYAGDDTHPAFSPDGNHLAYISNREGVAVGRPINFEIYLLDLATKRERRLTENDAFEAGIAWSPDGTTLAFKSHRDGNDEIYVMAPDGSGQTNLTRHPASDSGPSYTPDGEFIVFSSDRDGNRELYRMRSDGSGVERLTDNPASDNGARLSPDGTRVAFVSDRDGNDDVYLLDLATGRVSRVTDAPLSDWSPVWVEDGTALVVTYGDWESDEWSLVRVSLDGNDRRVLFEGTDSGNAAWRARDGALAFGAGTEIRDSGSGPGRVHLALPDGAGRQPVTGQLAGVHGGVRQASGGQKDPPGAN